MFPGYKLIRNTENLGFAKANNIGMAQCSGDFVCLVNSDVKFIDDCISPMLAYLSENPDVAMLGPKMLAASGDVGRSTMRFPTVWNVFCRAVGLDVVFKHSRLFGGHLMRDFDHDTTVPVEVLNGWFVLVRRSALDHVGLLDPQFFMYGEDMDWCYRFHEAGEKVVFFAGAGAIHYGGGSSSNAPLRFYLELYLRQLAVLEKASRLVFPYGIPRQFGPAPPDSTSRRGGGVRLVAVGEGRQRDSHAALPRMLAMAVSSRSQSDRYRDQPREQNRILLRPDARFPGFFFP